jgi:hypothetical protein
MSIRIRSVRAWHLIGSQTPKATSSSGIYDAATLKCGVTVADCYHGRGHGENHENAGVKNAEVITGRLVQDERGWLRLAV